MENYSSAPAPQLVPGSAIARSMEAHMNWLNEVIDLQTQRYFQEEQTDQAYPEPPPLSDTPLDRSCEELDLEEGARLLLCLALAPHVQPQLLDLFFVKNKLFDRGFTEFGGITGSQHGGFLPTAETGMFLLGGTDMQVRLAVWPLFESNHPLYTANLLEPPPRDFESLLSHPLRLTRETLNFFLTGESSEPEFSPGFPARRIETGMVWEDLVLNPGTLEEVMEIRQWLEFGQEALDDWGLSRLVKPGYRSLFHGPPGTGKTLTATLLGKATDRPVYRVDLSMVVSKFIGETEKNLSQVFDQAERRDWILFFDEADALFGKRTLTSSSNDRYANQEVSYLLQRVEDYPGVVLLASNFKGNIDEAFKRRFQSFIHFPRPNPQQRRRLWQMALGPSVPKADDLDLDQLARHYEITGGEIVNVVRHAVLRAYRRTNQVVTNEDIASGVRREFQKDGRLFDAHHQKP